MQKKVIHQIIRRCKAIAILSIIQCILSCNSHNAEQALKGHTIFSKSNSSIKKSIADYCIDAIGVKKINILKSLDNTKISNFFIESNCQNDFVKYDSILFQNDSFLLNSYIMKFKIVGTFANESSLKSFCIKLFQKEVSDQTCFSDFDYSTSKLKMDNFGDFSLIQLIKKKQFVNDQKSPCFIYNSLRKELFLLNFNKVTFKKLENLFIVDLYIHSETHTFFILKYFKEKSLFLPICFKSIKENHE